MALPNKTTRQAKLCFKKSWAPGSPHCALPSPSKSTADSGLSMDCAI